MRTGFLKKFLMLLLVFALVMPACAFAAPTEGAETDVFDNGLMRGSYYREGGTLHYNIEELTDLGGDIYAALYDGDGNLVDAKVGEASGSFECPAGAGYEIKAYLWDENQSPLCEPLEFGIYPDELPIVTGTVVADKITDYGGEPGSGSIRVKVSAYSGSDGAYAVGETYDFADPSDLMRGCLGCGMTMNIKDGAIAAAAPSADNKIERFSLGEFAGREGGVINFAGQRSVEADGIPVVYNGIGGYDLSRVFAPTEPDGAVHIIEPGCAYGGSVAAVSNDGDDKADIILVRLEESGVVDAASESGRIMFKNTVGSSERDNRGVIDFSDKDSVISLTKGGKPYDYKELREWDVLSVTANTVGAVNVYNIEVKTAEEARKDTYIADKTSSELSSDGWAYTLSANGKTYDLAANVYSDARLDIGSYAAVYIDKYNKIIASVKDKSKNYAYVLDAEMAPASFGAEVPMILILYKDGTTAAVRFADSVGVYNPTPAFGADNEEFIVYKYKEDNNAGEVLNSIVGRVVELNVENGDLLSLTLPYEGSDAAIKDSVLSLFCGPGDYSYDSGDMKIGTWRIGVDENTLVFFIGETGTDFEYGKPVEMFRNEYGKVISGSELREISGSGTRSAVAYTDDDSDSAAVLVIYNSVNDESAPVTPVTEPGIAFVSGTAVKNGVLEVEYYQDGELKTAAAAPGLSSACLNADTQPGTLLGLEVSDGIITAVEPYLTFYGEILSDIAAGGKNPGVPKIDEMNTQCGAVFGALVGYDGNGLFIAPMSKEDALPDFANIQYLKLGDQRKNIGYNYDSAKAAGARCEAPGLLDFYVDPYLSGDCGVSTGDVIEYGGFSSTNPVPGMLDYTYVITHGGKTEVVMYRQRRYDFKVRQ